ncbi:hypothetical protein LXL04_038345 [Taraxacum kok-saghyz]
MYNLQVKVFWDVVKNHPKWKTLKSPDDFTCGRGKRSKTSESTYANTESSDGRTGIDLNVEEPSESPRVHVGRDAAKAKRKQKGVSDSSSDATYTSEHLEKLNFTIDKLAQTKQLKEKKAIYKMLQEDPDLDPEVKKEALAKARQDFYIQNSKLGYVGIIWNIQRQKTETGSWFVSVVVAGRVPVVTTGVTGEHRCVSWLLVVINGRRRYFSRQFFSRGAAVKFLQSLIGLFVIRGDRRSCVNKNGQKVSVKAGGFGFASFGNRAGEDSSGAAVVVVMNKQKTENGSWFLSVVVAGRVPVVTTGVTGEHRCVSWLLVVINGRRRYFSRQFFSRGAAVKFLQSLIGLFVIRGDRRSCVNKNGQKVSVKAGGFGFASFGNRAGEDSSGAAVVVVMNKQKTENGSWFLSVVVAGRVPVVTTGVTGEHRCVSWLLVVINGRRRCLLNKDDRKKKRGTEKMNGKDPSKQRAGEDSSGAAVVVVMNKQKTENGSWFVSVVVTGRVPVVTTGVTGEHRCVSRLLVVINGRRRYFSRQFFSRGAAVKFLQSLIGLFVIRGDRRSCVNKNGQKVSVKAGGFGFASFGNVRKR